MERKAPIRTLILAFDGINLLDIGGPLQALEASERHRGTPERYETIVASVQGGEVQTSARMPIVTRRLADLDGLAIDTLIVGGGSTKDGPLAPPELVEWLIGREGSLRRVCSICAGAFILATAGLLEGRRATTHWHWAAMLQARYPGIAVEPDSIYVSDGKFWTSAGVTAGIDLTLALIEQDYSHRVAIEAARRLVVFMKRPGGQAQFSVPLLLQSGKDERFAELHAWMRENLTRDLRVEQLAARAGMSERSFTRAYVASIGSTPARSVEAMRVEAATGLLESTRLSLKQVAAAAGFGDEQNLRRVFVRRFGVNPLAYRERFAAPDPSTPGGN
ncbi:GlxA family transcriptional regulator [Sphingomonas koreensis]